MLFLIEYDRERGEIVSLRKFSESEKNEAERARLELEVHLSRHGVKREVVILDAVSEKGVRQTHRRYFESLQELAKAS